jgi:Cutinase
MVFLNFRIKGVVKEKETGCPLSWLFVKSYDKDLVFDDLLGSAMTDQHGNFEIVCELTDFRDFFDVKPDIYFKVFDNNRATLIHTTKKGVKWNVGKISEHEILIPWEELHSNVKSEVILSGDDGVHRQDFSVGESLTIQAKGLRPAFVHSFALTGDGMAIFKSRLITNRYGEIEPTVLWPQMGLDDPNSKDCFTPEEAEKKWNGKTFNLAVSNGKEIIFRTTFKITTVLHTPLLIASDRNGKLLNGFEVGTNALFLTLYKFQSKGDVRIYMVPRQHDWQIGDPFHPVTFHNGTLAVKEISIRGDGAQQIIEFASAEILTPGAYDFIVRQVRYGFEEDDLLHILPNDVIGSRRSTGLVIRESFWAAKPVLGGCVNKIPASGHSISGAPYFRYADTFTIGEDVWVGLDPGIIDPSNVSKMCALYVIQSKDDAGWINSALNHLAILGGNGNTIKHKVQAGCMNANKILVWPNAMQPGEYDIVADFGNNTPDASLFMQDDQYDTPLDIIDGYFVSGFRVVNDPGTMEDFVFVGNWNYDENVVNGMGLQGTVTVQDEVSDYHSSESPILVNRQVRMKANVYFPADIPGVTDPAQISTVQTDYPLIVIIHGNGHDYTTYDFLLNHFARNGFIAASIDVRYLSGGVEVHNMKGLGRANALFPHFNILNTKFGSHVENNIGIMGHSRGGEAVIKAARLNQQGNLGHNINAVISLAPTDKYGSEILGGLWSKPYFVLYGSRDGDEPGVIETSGYTVPQTGFSLYDRASGSQKSMCFVYRATHNGFITDNHDAPWDGDIEANMEPVPSQRAFTKAYMNAFFRWHLKNELQWDGMFKGEWTPSSISSTGAKFYTQYNDSVTQVVDNFEGVVDWQTSTMGGSVTHNGTLPVDPVEDKMSAAVIAGLDPKSPHDTQGIKIKWDNLNDKLVFNIPIAHKDISSYSTLSFRVTQKVDSPDNPANQSQNFRVSLKDGANNERAVRVSPFYVIPFPDYRPNHANSKSAMTTIRIPLKSYTIVCAGQVQVNLQDIKSLSFLFSEKATGEIEIDEVEFSN